MIPPTTKTTQPEFDFLAGWHLAFECVIRET